MTYPSEYELDVVLRDGGGARIAPIIPDHAADLVDFFERLGPQSRYYRFFSIKESLEPSEVEYFTTVDYSSRMALVAFADNAMVAVARYDKLDEDPGTAEVAFAVADAYQGRGLGTLLLDLLTSYARQHAVVRFRAFVLPENRQMMRVFRNSGFSLTRSLGDGMYTVDFPVEESDDHRAIAAEHEKRAVASSLLPMFFPRSVAVIGASTTPGSIGSMLFNNILRQGFTGPLYPVNPTSKVVSSVKAYPSVLDVPDEVDLAYVVVPKQHVVDVARQCAEKGVRGLVVISAGFSEVGEEGAAAEAELLDVVRRAGMRMVGPNCMGLINTSSAVNLNGTFAPVYPPPGNVAMSSQSGALGIAILDYAAKNNIGISQFVSVGNKADVSGNDLLLAWEDDPQTDVITMYLESFGNPRKFSRIARRIARTKPIVAVKSGRTGAGSRAAISHTGALASSDTAVSALFRQAGVIRVDTLEELFAAAALLSNQPVPRGGRVGVVTNAGGPGILAADALESKGLELPELTSALQDEIGARLHAEASTRNPIDLIASGGPEQFAHATSVLLESGEVDTVMVIYVPTSPEGAELVGAALRTCQDAYQGDVTLLSVFMQSADAARFLVGAEDQRTIPSYVFPEAAALALARAVGYGQWKEKPFGDVPSFPDLDRERAREVAEEALTRLGDEGGWLEPAEVDALLGTAGLRVPLSGVATDEAAAVELAGSFPGPAVLKVVSASALHKSDVGGVALDVSGGEAVGEAYRKVTAAVDDAEGVLVQEFIPGGHEVLVGMTEDPNFGPLVVFGLGGVYVELLHDVAFRIHPLTDADAAEMVREIRGFPILDGYRNLPKGDVDAVEEALLRLSALIGLVPELFEMDLNPVKVLEPGNGVVVVDARMRLRPLPPTEAPAMRDLPGVVSRT